MRRSGQVLFLLAIAISLAAVCGCGGSSITANNNVTSITIAPVTAGSTNVALGGSLAFNATVTLADSTITTSTAVTWQVNGVTGGSPTTGKIVSSSTATNQGVYTAPQTVPNTNINITAIITETPNSNSTSTTTITSNSIGVSIGSGTGLLTISPAQVTVRAGATLPFTAEFNNVVDSNATWSVSLAKGSCAPSTPDCIGSIDPTGLYTAPDAPPPNGQVTVTATDPTQATTPVSATVTIAYSAASMRGPFAFYYVGDDATGFRAVAGRFVADGAGNIQGGLEDVDSFGRPVESVQIRSGTYVVGPDGRTSASITTSSGNDERWQFVLTSTSHALLIRFDSNTTGYGTIDQQNLNDLSNPSVISGNYVFRTEGADTSFNPLAIAGRFTADGAGGIPTSASILDENDNGTVKKADTSLNGSYSFDAANSGSGRGTLTLTSASTGQLQFVFYVIDNTHLYLVETDRAAYLAGEVYSGATGSSFDLSELTASNYVFTVGGNSSSGAYAAGGVLASDGNGNITSGTLDANNAGTLAANTSISASTYTVDPTTGRIDLNLGSMEFAAYPTASNTALLVELDSTETSSGKAYLQAASPAALAGHFGLTLRGQGVFYNNPALYQSDVEGEGLFSGTTFAAGSATLDINNYGTSPILGDPLGTSSTVAAPGSNGRGTVTLAPTNPPATYSLVYYVIDPNTAVFVGQDTTRVLTGVAIKQF
ncbi:MAG: beta strand repeat-containing protein [Candidatus Acidiferrales bacterium]